MNRVLLCALPAAVMMIGTLTLNFALWLLFASLSTLFFVLAGGVGSADAKTVSKGGCYWAQRI